LIFVAPLRLRWASPASVPGHRLSWRGSSFGRMSMDALNVGFVGGGMMAEAMMTGLIKAGKVKKIVVSEPAPSRRKVLEEKTASQSAGMIKITDSNVEAFDGSDVVVIAVKPQVLDTVLKDMQAWPSQVTAAMEKTLVLSIVAGKTLANFEQYLNGCKIARVMPNTPSLVGFGASCYVLNGKCSPVDGEKVEAVMGACGIVQKLDQEKLLDAVTGLSGSGPAYVYLLIEAMADGGVRMGLPRATALQLAAQTVLGAGKMVLETGKHPGELKDAVTSPGGTTIAGVHALEVGSFRGTVINAVEAATKRSQELGRL